MIDLHQPMRMSPYGSEGVLSYEGFFIPSFVGDYMLNNHSSFDGAGASAPHFS